MSQRLYWVPHTLCFLGCEHCHNDSRPHGAPGSAEVIDASIAHLPGPDSPYRLEDVVIGGGEPLFAPDLLERMVRGLRSRYPQGTRSLNVAERRSAGYLIIAVQTNGLLLADSDGALLRERVERWLEIGVDYYHVASGDGFHQSRRPGYPWGRLFADMSAAADYGAWFRVYGKPPTRLVPSGRVLTNRAALEQAGASLLLEPDYCATGWETASNWMHPERAYPDCSELVIDENGFAHPCCWYRISPALFDLKAVSFEAGMALASSVDSFRLLDRGDVVQVGVLAGLEPDLSRGIRDAVGDCGACRLYFARLAGQGCFGSASPVSDLTPSEIALYDLQLKGAALDGTLSLVSGDRLSSGGL